MRVIHTDPTVGRWPDHAAGAMPGRCDMCPRPGVVIVQVLVAEREPDPNMLERERLTRVRVWDGRLPLPAADPWDGCQCATCGFERWYTAHRGELE